MISSLLYNGFRKKQYDYFLSNRHALESLQGMAILGYYGSCQEERRRISPARGDVWQGRQGRTSYQGYGSNRLETSTLKTEY